MCAIVVCYFRISRKKKL